MMNKLLEDSFSLNTSSRFNFGSPNAGLREHVSIILFIKLLFEGLRCFVSSSNIDNIPCVLCSSISKEWEFFPKTNTKWVYWITELEEKILPMIFSLFKNSICGTSSPSALYQSNSSVIKRLVVNARIFSFRKFMHSCSNELFPIPKCSGNVQMVIYIF